MASRTLVVALTVAAALAATPVVTAGSIELAWDSSDTASGYRVHYGTDPGQYTGERNVGNTTRTTVTGLPDCVTLYIAVTAYNAAGNSGFSNEVDNWGQPEIMSADPASAIQGDQFTLTLTGANFQSGTVLTHDNPNVILTGVAVVSCNQIQAVATVEPTAAGVRPAEIGGVTFTVENPDGLSDETQPFSVLVNEARFDVNKTDARTSDRIDGQDTVWLSRRFGGQEGVGSLYHPDFDFNGDGWVDGEDLSYIASNLGSCWTGTTWMPSVCQ